MKKRKKINYVCKLCGWIGPSKTFRRGTREDEFWLWAICTISMFAFWPIIIVPLVFSIYKFKTKYKGCECCRGHNLIPAHSIEGRRIIGNFEREHESIRAVCSVEIGQEVADTRRDMQN
ncbi:MAG: hypothetical protein GY839_09235 [candidate division Zixibacteria bacterium]|nr:hypothetical protein [candidate division Zixibacteria bacterium]